jgi:hypothetical protein
LAVAGVNWRRIKKEARIDISLIDIIPPEMVRPHYGRRDTSPGA